MATFGNTVPGSTLTSMIQSNMYCLWNLPSAFLVNGGITSTVWFYGRKNTTGTAQVKVAIYKKGFTEDLTVLVDSTIITVSQTAAWYSTPFVVSLDPGASYIVTVIPEDSATGTVLFYTTSGGSNRNVYGVNFIPPVTLSGATSYNNEFGLYVTYEENVVENDLMTITSDAVIVHPEIFTFASPTEADVVTVNFDMFDVKLKHTCNHKLLSGTYKLTTCPRCLGTGYYYDIKFNDVGKLTPVNLSEKLAQILEKLAVTEENKYHPEIAINVQKWLGSMPVTQIKTIIQFDLIKSLMTLQEIQKGAANLTGDVQIGRIDNVAVFEDESDPMRLYYIVKVTTVAGVVRELSGSIILNG